MLGAYLVCKSGLVVSVSVAIAYIRLYFDGLCFCAPPVLRRGWTLKAAIRQQGIQDMPITYVRYEQ